MISWSNQLYLSESISKRELKSIKKKLEKNKFFKGVYCITFASNIENLFDIYNIKQFFFPYYTNTFVSLTYRKNMNQGMFATPEFTNWHKNWQERLERQEESIEEAYELIIEMIEDIYKETDEFKVRDYFS